MFLGIVAFNMSIRNIRVRCKGVRRGTGTGSYSCASTSLSAGTGLGMIHIGVVHGVVRNCNGMMIAVIVFLPCLLGCCAATAGMIAKLFDFLFFFYIRIHRVYNCTKKIGHDMHIWGLPDQCSGCSASPCHGFLDPVQHQLSKSVSTFRLWCCEL